MTVVDYNCGNLFSVQQALESFGVEVKLANTAEDVCNAERLVLPGVGAFGDAANKLCQRDLFEPLRDYTAGGKPLLGICVGMQLLFDRSEEFGDHEGLGFFPGAVTAISKTTLEGEPQKIPHIGWSRLVSASDLALWENTILDNFSNLVYCYFVHSFAANPENEKDRLGDCYYGGHRIAAVVRRGSVWGCQFHPEKSGSQGLQIISNFLRLGANGQMAPLPPRREPTAMKQVDIKDR